MIRITHPFQPVFDEKSRILILGSFPSVKSREGEFYYHHPQNRFWRVISSLFQEELPITIPEKKSLLLRHQLALWDVVESCEITGSSDSSIRNVVCNDISSILKLAQIRCIIANGSTADRLYCRYVFPITNRGCVKLPSTSPANAAFNLDRLLKEWSYLLSYYEN